MSSQLELDARRRAGRRQQDPQLEARRILAQRELDRRRARTDMSFLLDHMSMVDEKKGSIFKFHLNDPTNGWYWQRAVLDDALATQISIFLKARQLGLTWLLHAAQIALALTRPGTRHLVFRQREEDANSIVDRGWELLLSLPPHLRMGVEVLKPKGGLKRDNIWPDGQIELLHPNGRRSTIQAMPPTGDPGHGETVASVLIDEAARIKKLADVLTAIMATVGTVGYVWLVSTANGVSVMDDDEDDDG